MSSVRRLGFTGDNIEEQADSLTKEQLDTQLQKGMDDIAAERVLSADAVEAELRGMYGGSCQLEEAIKAWDPDFTKVTPEEARQIAQAEKSGFIDEEDIDWDNLDKLVL